MGMLEMGQILEEEEEAQQTAMRAAAAETVAVARHLQDKAEHSPVQQGH
jgi:hypothetical protein